MRFRFIHFFIADDRFVFLRVSSCFDYVQKIVDEIELMTNISAVSFSLVNTIGRNTGNVSRFFLEYSYLRFDKV